ncbi:rhamnosyltransferase [Biostraticola tofi]|nr:rhamnosyltransferase [Biostraticola tofi]
MMEKSIPHVCAIIVTFNPEIYRVEKVIGSLSRQVADIIIIDNASDTGRQAALIQLTEADDHRHLFIMGENQGIAAAQNAGIRISWLLNASHVLLLDHDSLPADDMVKQLLLVESRQLMLHQQVGAVGPSCIDRRTLTRSGFVSKRGILIRREFPGPAADCIETDFLIASGMLIRCRVLKDVGLMRDELFIDQVDTEWCFRAASRGYHLYGASKACLIHCLGDSIIRIWLGRWREVPAHSPQRNYFIFRNTLLLLGCTPMSLTWRLAHIYRLMIFFLFFTLLAAPRWQRMKMMLLGVRDGFKAGRMPTSNSKSSD